jgi:flagellar biosynthesis GTPase FlhF
MQGIDMGRLQDEEYLQEQLGIVLKSSGKDIQLVRGNFSEEQVWWFLKPLVERASQVSFEQVESEYGEEEEEPSAFEEQEAAMHSQDYIEEEEDHEEEEEEEEDHEEIEEEEEDIDEDKEYQDFMKGVEEEEKQMMQATDLQPAPTNDQNQFEAIYNNDDKEEQEINDLVENEEDEPDNQCNP